MAAISDDEQTESEPPPYAAVTAAATAPAYTRHRNRQRQPQPATATRSSTNTPISLTLIYQLLQLTSLLPALTGVLYLLIRFSLHTLPAPNPSRIEYLASTPWAVLTAVYSFQIISSMLHRWKQYYHPISVIIRLLSIQAASFPWIRVTLWLCSTPEKPLLAWMVVAITTAVSSSIARWYISNLSSTQSARHIDVARLVTRTILPISTLSLFSLFLLLYDLYYTRVSLQVAMAL
ncbi:hypothetical protein E3P92_01516 [Wallemia ichthyophaga]|uniref:N-glycosylation protein eos1 n=2 Tax=Wallemia ichthyophaga TaxID=245174 RepID=A0A4T0HDH2_WALIC|nr:uncharacterized protein J056_004129 [Wallemia ichthyophaga EXF-994]TIA73586.1 hypothetical protein E3P91_01346 [Wallemia ichthyophaga]EOR01343.1 hypothetical protein J056_004129 [Wallemia ichthyophaga EXF-994]TIA82426.1 hypothetical protein E3P98_01367 [Wallemia ichthyophaga]TIA91870.1 hypothetical protein E3P97_01755 [Wallemia ichthyophaga]TIA98451.1 hypothetical protein E3P96_03156 [Wallemia ichthyophaga]